MQRLQIYPEKGMGNSKWRLNVTWREEKRQMATEGSACNPLSICGYKDSAWARVEGAHQNRHKCPARSHRLIKLAVVTSRRLELGCKGTADVAQWGYLLRNAINHGHFHPNSEFNRQYLCRVNTRWVFSACHPSEVGKMSISLLVTEALHQRHSCTPRKWCSQADKGCIRIKKKI